MSVLDVVAGDAVAAYSGAPSWVIPPADGSINTQAFVELTNPATGETWMAPSGGYTVNPDVTTQIPQQVTIPAMQGVQTQPVDRPVADVVEGNRFQMQYPEDGLLTDPTIFAAIDILNRAPAVGPTAAAAAADQSTLLGSGLYEVLPDTDPAIESDVTPLYGVDWRDRIEGTEEQPEGITTTITTDDSSYDDSWENVTYDDFLTDLSGLYDTSWESIGETITSTLDDFGLGSVSDALSDIGVSIGEVATDLGSGFVQIGDAIVDSATGVVTDLSGDLMGVVEDIGETITSTLDDFGLGDVSDALSDIGVSIGEVATDLGSGFVQIGDAIVDSATGVVTDLSGDIMGVVEDIGEDIGGAVTDITADFGAAVDEIGAGIDEALTPVSEALSPITETLSEVKEDVSGFVGDIESVVGDAIVGALPDQPDDPTGVGAQYQGDFGAVLSVINNMAEGMTVEEALDALYSDPETGLAPGEVGSPYGWDWGSVLDPAYGALSFTTPYDVVDAQGDPATNDPGGVVTDSEGNPVAVESGGVLGYGDLDTAADVYGTTPGSEQTGMLTEQDAGLTDYSDANLGTAAEYGTEPGSEQTAMLAEQDSLGFDPSDPDDFTADFGPDGVEGTGFDGAFGSDMGFGDDSGFTDDGTGFSGAFGDDMGFGGWGDDGGFGGFGGDDGGW